MNGAAATCRGEAAAAELSEESGHILLEAADVKKQEPGLLDQRHNS